MGVGGVGGELIEQVKRQKEYPAKKNVEIEFVLLRILTVCCLDENGLNLEDWKTI